MKTVLTVLIVVAVVLVVAFVILYFVGNKMQKKQDASEAQMKAASQAYSILVIDKKKMKLSEANLPKMVLDQTPKYLRRSKVPIVKAKLGPKVMTFICDAKVFDVIPVKKEVKAVISGIYIMDVRGLRSSLDQKPEKKSFLKKLLKK